MKLNLGCGNDLHSDHINIDIRDLPGVNRIMDISKLDYPDNSIDSILALDVLEHFSHTKTIEILSEWIRVLKPGGSIHVRVPDLKSICEHYLGIRPKKNIQEITALLYAGPDFPMNHLACFDSEFLKYIAEDVGLKVISVMPQGGTNILMVAIKK